jgi:hypothetical protein
VFARWLADASAALAASSDRSPRRESGSGNALLLRQNAQRLVNEGVGVLEDVAMARVWEATSRPYPVSAPVRQADFSSLPV